MAQDTMTSDHRTRPAPRLAALAGIAVPAVFLPVVVLLTWAEYEFMRGLGWLPFQDYGGMVPFPSSLARGPYGWVQSANFLLAGVLALVLLSGLRGQFRRRWSGRVATVALAVFGIAGFLNAVPTALPDESFDSVPNIIHLIGFAMTMLGGIVGTTAAGLALRGQPAWRGWWVYSLLTGPAVLVCLTGVLDLPGDIEFYFVLVLLFGWFGAVGWRLRRLVSEG